MTVLLILSLILIIEVSVMALATRYATEGFQDKRGFHYGPER